MKRLTLLLFIGICAAAQQAGTRSVYILPMAGGLDQYLADQLTRDHVMQVVADPKIADVILTERLSSAFEQALAKVHPRAEDPAESAMPHHEFRTSGSKGTIFLVDTRSRAVIWSDYEKPDRNITGTTLNREAVRIAKKLQETLPK